MDQNSEAAIESVTKAWPIFAGVAGFVAAGWNFVSKRTAKREARLARIERSLNETRATFVQRGELSDVWQNINHIREDVSGARESLARIEGALGIRNGQ